LPRFEAIRRKGLASVREEQRRVHPADDERGANVVLVAIDERYRTLADRDHAVFLAFALANHHCAAFAVEIEQRQTHKLAAACRVPVSAPPRLARALGVSVEELLGEPISAAAKKRGPAPKLQQQLERISKLPKPKQRFVIQMLDTILAQHSHGASRSQADEVNSRRRMFGTSRRGRFFSWSPLALGSTLDQKASARLPCLTPRTTAIVRHPLGHNGTQKLPAGYP
jgi:hypothetical protein